MSGFEEFIPILMLFGFAVLFAAGVLIMSYFAGPRNSVPEKLTTYECGMPLLDEAHKKFSIKYFLIAALFLIFDIEIAFLYPWAYYFRSFTSTLLALAEVFVFVLILFIGWFYLYKRGALDWE